MPGGRPSKYDPKFCEDIVEWMREGVSKEACAGKLEIAKDTLYRWIAEHPEFSDAIRRGEQLSRQWWEARGREAMLGQIPGFNATVWVMSMKNMHGYRDRTDHQHSGPGGGPIQTTSKVIQVAGVEPGEDPDT